MQSSKGSIEKNIRIKLGGYEQTWGVKLLLACFCHTYI